MKAYVKQLKLTKPLTVITGLACLFLSTLCIGGEISKIKVDVHEYVIEFEGDGVKPPLNKLITMTIKPLMSKAEPVTGAKDMQKLSIESGVEASAQSELASRPKNKDAADLNAEPAVSLPVKKLPDLKEFDIVMPAHKHGMFVTPVIKALGYGTYQISGIKLHMMGYWEIQMQWVSDEKIVNVNVPLNL